MVSNEEYSFAIWSKGVAPSAKQPKWLALILDSRNQYEQTICHSSQSSVAIYIIGLNDSHIHFNILIKSLANLSVKNSQQCKKLSIFKTFLFINTASPDSWKGLRLSQGAPLWNYLPNPQIFDLVESDWHNKFEVLSQAKCGGCRKEGFITETPGSNVIKLFLFVIYKCS